MPFYELVCISRARLSEPNLADLLRKTATQVMERGGVVRGFENMGEQALPYRMKRHQTYHSEGRYWLMHFDANPNTLTTMDAKLRVDPRVIRHTFIKLGSKLEDVVARPDKT
ncbi:30S ribosomal protein S6 [Basidiobolus meristosporus CBS 931.73]|uniref:30S ribosomal protein S6 n=1 Tax=Basidiobolus meristosporus CBS 931.73 TaxID=1314790 RepID=A0A1Y1X7G4_9FUNG|nr:30S ribosomal protein S6 [Basidiobolus meristosporus CBS 931.73]|eukprot:ORX81710.1 30S ribosomal protein S6 [Basidiobolus meristosporus CBS 931.73]